MLTEVLLIRPLVKVPSVKARDLGLSDNCWRRVVVPSCDMESGICVWSGGDDDDEELIGGDEGDAEEAAPLKSINAS